MRKHFTGNPEHVINLLTFVAEEVREILARLGARNLEEIIGHTEYLTQISRGDDSLDDLDMNALLARIDTGGAAMYCTRKQGKPRPVASPLDERILADAAPLFAEGSAVDLRYSIRNTDRTIGAGLASRIVREIKQPLAAEHVRLRFRGTAGQSFGAWAVAGMRLVVEGDANDYVGKGLSGGVIVVRPSDSSTRASERNAIVGNTVLYGATGGRLFAAGRAGERFAVRNSGADAVVEGCGSNGCEYMTGGEVLVLGEVGDNFAAGMTGGIAYVYDACGGEETQANGFLARYNGVHVELFRLQGYWEDRCRELLATHVRETGSGHAQRLLEDWEKERTRFWQVVPKETLGRLAHPVGEGQAPTLPLLPEAAE